MKKLILAFAFLGSIASPVWANTATDNFDPSSPKTLDGVEMEAVETYINPRSHELSFGVGLFPFNPYYNGFGTNFAYAYYFSNTWAWEVLNGSYAFSVAKDLTSELADKFGVNPTRIEKLNYVATTNAVYIINYGKSVIFRKFIQYFRTSLLFGGGVVATTVQTKAAASLGARFDGYINETFSWRLEVRDAITVTGGVSNNIAFNLGTLIYF